ncbi:sensor histidine kinase [Aeromicrobium sp. UC242_57]|uniref:sensor histidine kinase n=1 Tax=Aeromicrobium sp. UC242_57 TaxID=3374624 RepID=UPI0037991F71
MGDSDRIHQVVTNLVENALRHGFGLREIALENSEHPAKGSGVLLQVHDNGPGIPEEMRQRVFSRFWRSGPGAGSGLGMYIVRGIVQEHGGDIEIGEADGGGAQIRGVAPDQRARHDDRLTTDVTRLQVVPATRAGRLPNESQVCCVRAQLVVRPGGSHSVARR